VHADTLVLDGVSLRREDAERVAQVRIRRGGGSAVCGRVYRLVELLQQLRRAVLERVKACGRHVFLKDACLGGLLFASCVRTHKWLHFSRINLLLPGVGQYSILLYCKG
jgi:hypothetical protein